MSIETHRLIATLTDGSTVVLASGLDWHDAIGRHTVLDLSPQAGVRYYCVRADDDPDPRWKGSTPLADKLAVKLFTSKVGAAQKNAGKAVARAIGWTSAEGGWIYDANGSARMQGYASLAHSFGCTYVATDKGYRFTAEGVVRIRKLERAARRRMLDAEPVSR